MKITLLPSLFLLLFPVSLYSQETTVVVDESVEVLSEEARKQEEAWSHLFDETAPSEAVVESEPIDEPIPPFPLGSDSIAPELSGWINWLVRTNTPRTYEDLRKWGKQKRVIDGLQWRREGIRLETKRRWKEVNHGTWTRYFAELVEPEKNLSIELTNLQTLPDGRLKFEATIQASLHTLGRLSLWQYDVQLISLHADADAAVKLWLACEVNVKLNPLTIPPDIILEPVVHDAKLELTHFRLKRLSQLGGPMAKHLGEGMRWFLDDRVAAYGDKLPAKINKAIEKKKDRLRISPQAWLQSKMQEWVKPQ